MGIILHHTPPAEKLYFRVFMARKGPKVGIGMLDFVEDIFVGVKSH